VDADGLVQIAVNRGNAGDRLALRAGDAFIIAPGARRKHDPRD
jgi:hypothetical protein